MSDYYKVDFEISPVNSDAADLLAAFLAEQGFESFEYSEKGIDCYVPAPLFDESEMKNVLDNFPIPVEIKYNINFIEHKDWNEEWEKNYFKPILLGDGKCVVHSTFHKDFPEAPVEIIVDPKMAFGTGHHATTSMMVNYLFETPLVGKTLMDMGTGTGILAIISKKLGAQKVIGVEIDPDAYENALENVRLNKADLKILNGDASLLKEFKGIDVFLANINRNIILEDLKYYVATLKPNGLLILSGFYEKDIPVIEEGLNNFGMKIVSVKKDKNGWCAVKASK